MNAWLPIAKAQEGEFVLACNEDNWPNSVRWVKRVPIQHGCDFEDRACHLYSGFTHFMRLDMPTVPVDARGLVEHLSASGKLPAVLKEAASMYGFDLVLDEQVAHQLRAAVQS